MTATYERADAQPEEGQVSDRTKSWDRAAMAGIAVGIAARAWVLVAHPPLNFIYSDMAGYVTRAQHLATGGPQGRIDAFYPSGTHVVLSIPFFIFGTGRTGLWAASILWFVLGSLTPWLAWRWTRRILTVQAASLTAIACAVWPLFVTQGGYFVSELPGMTLLLAGLLLATRVRDSGYRVPLGELGLLGGVVGLGITVRPQLALNYALMVVPAVWALRRQVVRLAAVALCLAVPIGLVIGINTDAAGQLTLLSENTGVNFFLAQCDGGRVDVYGPHGTYYLESPVYAQTHRGRSYAFEGRDIWDQSFFVDQAFQCVKSDGVSHVHVVGQHVLDLTASSTPWPQSGDPSTRGLARVTNVGYSLLLPTIIVASLIVFWRRRAENRGPRLVLAHLLCLLPTVIFFVSEPRYRIPYDVFGLALLAALLVRMFQSRLPASRPSGRTSAQTVDGREPSSP